MKRITMKYFYTLISISCFSLLSCSTEQPLTPDENVDPVEATQTEGIVDQHTPAFPIAVVDLADIVADTKAGKTNYEGRLITVNAAVVDISIIPGGNSFLTIDTKADQVIFYISTVHKAEAYADYEIGGMYNFTVYIYEQHQEADDRFRIWTYFSKEGVENVTLETLLTDAKQNNGRYEGCVVRFEAAVFLIYPDGDLLIKTPRNEVAFLLTDRSKYDPDTVYVVDASYTFTVILGGIGDGKPDSKPFVTCNFIKQQNN